MRDLQSSGGYKPWIPCRALRKLIADFGRWHASSMEPGGTGEKVNGTIVEAMNRGEFSPITQCLMGYIVGKITDNNSG